MNWAARVAVRVIGWVIFALIAALILAFGGFSLFKKPIAGALFERVVEQRVGVDRSAELADGLHIYLCGTGSPMPDASRAGPCLGVVAGERAFVFDVGSGGARNLGGMGFPIARLESVFLTHLHSDHVDGLGELLVLSWVAGSRSVPTPVAGPVGTREVVDGFNHAYRIDRGYRIAHHGPEVANPDGFGGVAREITLQKGLDGQVVVFAGGDVKITAVRVNHAPVEPAFGYRIDYKDRSVAISGDTVFHQAFVEASRGVDLMLHDALDPEMVAAMGRGLSKRGLANNAKIFADIPDYHASPEDAARAAQQAGAGHLVLYHLVPPLPLQMLESVFLGNAASEFDGPITVGRDGVIMSLPASSDDIDELEAL